VDPETPLEETMQALDQIVRSGKALYAGLSNYPPDLTAKAAKILRSLGTPCLIHQAKYNMFHRWVEDGLLQTLKKEGIGCIAFSPLAQGLLTNRYLEGIPNGSRASKPNTFLKKEDVESQRILRVRQLNEIALRRGQTMAQMALAWDLRHPEMTSVVIGASRVSQIEDAVGAVKQLSFSKEELTEIDTVLAEK